MRREFGEGRWDKILVKRMLELSVSDDYTVARDEWIATGDVWWSGSYSVPDWVQNSNHPNHCLCGHGIVYHFRIRNTENGAEEIVGSDHINSYLIMKQIAQENSIDLATVTDEQVELWLKERVGSMKAEAWWKENGDAFTNMFDTVKDLDVWTNVYLKERVYVENRKRYEQQRVLRKKGSGEYGLNYDMASLVWRWNHPNNPKAQIKTRGYPNDKLMMDLSLFFAKSFQLRPAYEKFQAEKANRIAAVAEQSRQKEQARLERIEKRKVEQAQRQLEWDAGAEERELKRKREMRERRIREEKRQTAKVAQWKVELDMDITSEFDNLCGFYGIPTFDASFAANASDLEILVRAKKKMIDGNVLSRTQLEQFKSIFDETPATEKQIKYLRDLGWDGEIPSKRFASKKITTIKGE